MCKFWPKSIILRASPSSLCEPAIFLVDPRAHSLAMASCTTATLNVRAEAAIKEWRATPDTMRVDFRACAVDPRNRGATLMNGARVHALLYSIIRSGFSERKAQTGIVVDIAPDRQADVVAHNARVVQGDPLLPEGSGVMPLFTVLHTNHFVMIGRCFYAGCPTTSQNQELGIATPDGRLSLDLLKNIDRAFYDYLTQGHHVVRLRPGIQDHPELVRAIISSCNHDLGMGETEAQLFVSAKELVGKGVAVETIAGDLKVQYPHLQHHCEPIAVFVGKFGCDDNAPFVKDLITFHSQHVDADKCKSEARFWESLSSLPSDFGWAVVAFAKDNWASDKVDGGICRGVAMGSLSMVRSRQSLMRALHEMLSAWRLAKAAWLAAVAEKTRARILGRLDILASRVTLKPLTDTPHPQNTKMTLRLSSLEDVRLVADFELAAALGAAKVGDVVPWPGDAPGGSDGVPSPALILPELGHLKVELKKKDAPKASPKAIAIAYDASGNVVNRRAQFELRGYVVGAKVASLCEVSACENGKEKKVAKNMLGIVIAIDDQHITIKLEPSGTAMWKWETFPFESVIVQEAPEAAGVTVVNLDGATECTLQATAGYKTAMAKASMLCAIDAVRHHLGNTDSRLISPYGSDVVPLRVQMKPKKGVFATALITVAEPLVLLPETTSLTLVDRTHPCFIKTRIEVGEQLLALNSVFIDPLSAKDGKAGVVVFFWLVRRSDNESDCNMKIVDSTVITGTGVTWPRGKLSTKSMEDVIVPTMISTKRITQDTELVCYYKEDAAPKLKRKRATFF